MAQDYALHLHIVPLVYACLVFVGLLVVAVESPLASRAAQSCLKWGSVVCTTVSTFTHKDGWLDMALCNWGKGFSGFNIHILSSVVH